LKEIYVLLAEYNAYVNGVLYGLLEQVPPDLVSRDSRSHYGSILGLLNHILRSDLGRLSRFRASLQGFRSLATAAIDFDPATAPKQLYANLADLGKRRQQVDDVFKAFAAELTDQTLRHEVTSTNAKGEQESFAVWEILLHLFNHQTHHRGQVSQILDAAGVQHDFSNVMTVLRMRKAAKA
jgi:uncharacterized damage-inducible protein DinB